MKVRRLLMSLLLISCLAETAGSADTLDTTIHCDPAKVLGAEACAKCHENEVRQWRQTPHFATFEALHRRPEAKEIVERLGLSTVKRNDVCVRCHYTRQDVEGRVRVVSGVSCESCHGAGKDWAPLHNDYGGPNVTKQQESPEHAQQRRAASVAAGMNNPQNLYLIARQCLSCHTTPDERLVNEGGHSPGSKDFELVSWSQGMVRHNFLRTGGATNATASPEELRVMYVVGVLADLEASFRSTALATHKATFGVTNAQRAATLKRRLYEIQKLVRNEHLQAALEVALAEPLKLRRSDELTAAADKIGAAAQAFAATANGAELAAIDSLLPKPETYKN
jgi:hypothetical protein